MRTLFHSVAVLAVAALLGSQAVAASLHSPSGTWITNGGESKYKLTLCGDGDDLCGILVWLRPDARNEATEKYLNKMLLNAAPRVASQKWRGQVSVAGRNFNGSITLLDANNIHIRGCEGALCQGIDLIRVKD